MTGVRRTSIAGILLLGGVIGLAGCGVDGQAVRSPVKLDTGPYSVTQTDDDASGPKHRAAVALGEFIPLRTEIDARIGHATVGSGPLSSVGNLSGLTDTDAEAVAANKEFLFGFTASGNNYIPGSGMDTAEMESLRAGVLRYTDEKAAAAALTPNMDAMLAKWKETYADEADDIETMPVTGGPAGAVMIRKELDGDDRVNIRAMAVNGRDLLYTQTYGYSAQSAISTVRRSLNAQKKASDASRAVDVVDEYANRDFFMLTVPFRKKDTRYMFEGAVAGPRAFATKYHDDKKFLTAFTEAGVGLISERTTVLYRAGSTEHAAGLRDFFYDVWMTDDTTREARSPLDLPSATCVHDENDSASDDPWFGCVVVVDRHVATSGGETYDEAAQAIAAQYELLTKFG